MIYIVSGLPRSGTSMMMQMLEAGGLPVLTDKVRQADADNARGYYELDAIKTLKTDATILEAANDRVIKVIAMLLFDLPLSYSYRVVFMLRNMDEILASQKRMLGIESVAREEGDEALAAKYRRHLHEVRAWLARQSHLKVLYCHYNEIQADPQPTLRRIEAFLGGRVQAELMRGAIDRALYRQGG